MKPNAYIFCLLIFDDWLFPTATTVIVGYICLTQWTQFLPVFILVITKVSLIYIINRPKIR